MSHILHRRKIRCNSPEKMLIFVAEASLKTTHHRHVYCMHRDRRCGKLKSRLNNMLGLACVASLLILNTCKQPVFWLHCLCASAGVKLSTSEFIIPTAGSALATEHVATDNYQQIWPTYAMIGWLTNPRNAALLWLVAQDIPQSFALWLKIDPVGVPSLLAAYRCLQLFTFMGLDSTPRYPAEYSYTCVLHPVYIVIYTSNSISIPT